MRAATRPAPAAGRPTSGPAAPGPTPPAAAAPEAAARPAALHRSAAEGAGTAVGAPGPGAVVAGVGIAVPRPVGQDELWEQRFRHHFGDSALARRIFASAGVRRRHTVVDLGAEDPADWSTADRMRRYAREAPALGHRAVTAALAEAGLTAADVGQLTVASCTGYDTPGLDIRLAGSLGMPVDAQRLLVGHMGCYAALPALGAAADHVAARGRPAVLLCLELPSLHLQPADSDTQQVVTHALFGDAAVALVLLPPGIGAAVAGPVPRPTAPAGAALELVDVVARTDPGTAELMTWQVTDLGFRMGLSPEVPAVLARHVRPVTEELLSRHGLAVGEVAGWAVHPGGPRILETVEGELALGPAALDDSRAVLAEYGNCSSPTVLLVLDRIRAGGAGPAGAPPPDGAPVVAMAFGPGLTLYAALFRVRRPAAHPAG
ncbi:type III polyketide synthase [Streptomyces lonarensis]|uniref:Type III polyketide synthase n=1 Tax=Streptomyces lonarensis TaxID=700599 RepID=A0A7X6D161_9ACTN|nr:type III polyketide synthase [Streptomyces lonarensis]